MFSPPDDHQRGRTPIDRAIRTLERGFSIILGLVAIAIFAGAVLLILKMDAGSRSQGGRFFVAIGALVLLGAVDSQYGWLVRRRVPLFSLVRTAAERRYRVVSLLLLFVAAVVLIGMAWLLP